jgi:hypothetical protein
MSAPVMSNERALEPLRLGTGVLRELECLGELEEESQFLWLEVDFFDEAAVSQIERHLGTPNS